MGHVYKNMAKEQATNKPSSSATAFNCGGSETGYQTFIGDPIATGDTSVFRAYEVDANGKESGAWQIFIGTVTDGTPDTVSQDTLIESSTGSFIDFSGAANNPMLEIVSPASQLLPMAMNFLADEWRQPMISDDTLGGVGNAANALHLTPIAVPHPCTLKALRGECSIYTATKNVKFALYDSSLATGLPNNLVYGSGNISVTGTGIYTDTLGSPQTIEAGWYWTAIHFEAANGSGVAFKGRDSSTAKIGAPYFVGMSSLDQPYSGYSGTSTFASGLPDPFSGSPAWLNSSAAIQAQFGSL